MVQRSPAERARSDQLDAAARDARRLLERQMREFGLEPPPEGGEPRLGPVLRPILAPVLDALRDSGTSLPACRELRRASGVFWLLPGSDLPGTLLCSDCADQAGIMDVTCIGCRRWCSERTGLRLATLVGDVTVEWIICHACSARDLAGGAP